jgi:hypothetical protein
MIDITDQALLSVLLDNVEKWICVQGHPDLEERIQSTLPRLGLSGIIRYDKDIASDLRCLYVMPKPPWQFSREYLFSRPQSTH